MQYPTLLCVWGVREQAVMAPLDSQEGNQIKNTVMSHTSEKRAEVRGGRDSKMPSPQVEAYACARGKRCCLSVIQGRPDRRGGQERSETIALDVK